MDEYYNNGRSAQLADIARELGLSMSTVSRVLSGKGNISAQTRKRVSDYIKLRGYHPNAMARGLATKKTHNIGVVIPSDAFLNVNSFFQVCLMGIFREAVKHNYDIVVTSATETDVTYLNRLISGRNVDGIILMRTILNDRPTEYLKEIGFPFVTIGSLNDEEVLQVDVAHADACRTLTGKLLENGNAPIGFIVGGMNYIVNISRYSGYRSACESRGCYDDSLVFRDITDKAGAEDACSKLTERGAGTIICGDDNLCHLVLARLDALGTDFPGKLGVASLYDSPALAARSVTAVEADDMALGSTAARRLIETLENEDASKDKTILGYKINYRRSTER